MTQLNDCFNCQDFARVARRRLPGSLYHYIEGAADDELTARANVQAFERYQLVPRQLRDIRAVDMRRRVFGCDLEWPVFMAPTGMSRLFHPDGEQAVAREAARMGAGYMLSTMATSSLEEVADGSVGPKIFQLYLLNDDGLNRAIIDRCKAAGYDAICLTVDCVVAGNRERDLRFGLTVPPQLNRRNILSFVQKPLWGMRYLAHGGITLPNVPTPNGSKSLGTLTSYFAQKMEQNITWARVEQLQQYWGKPFIIKGLQSVADARDAVVAGVSGIIVSNHGGRQLDGSPAVLDLIADIVDAVDDQLEVVLDGGIRRGNHVVKALALGARACLIGRPYLYALSAYGQPGVARMLELMRRETERTLALIGVPHIDDLDRSALTHLESRPVYLSASVPTGALRSGAYS
ncbi:alpha-hydroxy acid oxidase [Pseudomonas sp. MYb185]|uniref:alpha-hydroxy acid oxidase n=1 Tax=Pseudomonas sp. MYb185 TaxID=1848729 RepID=UPI001304C2DB|nr:alpha-hydroxy acid oxidase [Pseudomonas sp. MYb185]